MVDFKFYLNRQGPRGQQGVKGDQGFSPQITVGKNTVHEYTLKIINEDGSFETENLKATAEDRGGTYLRYDRNTYQEYIGDPDFATTEQFGVVRLATKEDLETQEESLAVSSAILNTYLKENYLDKVHGDVVTGDVSFRGDTGFTKSVGIEKLRDTNSKVYLTRANNITTIGNLAIPDYDTRLTQGSNKIAYISDLAEFVTSTVLNSAISNMVTTDTKQTITGDKIFTGSSEFDNGLFTKKNLYLDNRTGDNPSISILNSNSTYPVFTPTSNGFKLGHTILDVVLSGNVYLDDGSKVLGQNSISAGDNIIVDKTANGVRISSTGSSGSGDVTLAGDNGFTGNNTFDGITTFNGYVWADEFQIGTSLTNQQGKNYLAQDTIIAGDNIAIEETTDGIKISSTASGGAEIDDATPATDKVYSSSKTQELIDTLQATITTLESNIVSLQTRVQALEDLIDGGNAGSVYPIEPQKIDDKPIVGNAISGGQSQSEDIQIKDGE